METFSDSEGPDEGTLTGKLVQDFLATAAADDLQILVAIEDDILVGGAICSRPACDDGTNAFLMAPVAVRTSFRKKGIGQALIASGLEHPRAMGVQLVMSYGDIYFYSKAGFATVAEETVPTPLPLSFPDGCIGQSLVGREIRPLTGSTHCVPAIDNGAYW